MGNLSEMLEPKKPIPAPGFAHHQTEPGRCSREESPICSRSGPAYRAILPVSRHHPKWTGAVFRAGKATRATRYRLGP